MNGLKLISVFICGFLAAQLIKIIVAFIQKKENLSEYIFKSGGMPSGHSASLAALATYAGFLYGVDSNCFALIICGAMIVVYDAVNVRYSVGEHGKFLKELAKEKYLKWGNMRIVEGHTVLEVFAGILVGVLIGWAFFTIF